MTRLTSLSLLAAVLVACGDDARSTPDAAITPDAAVAIDASTTDGPVAEPPPGVGLAVVNSDFTSTSIALIDRTGLVTRGDCIDSGTHSPSNTLALSGDVVLPSQAQPDHLLVTIDRTNSALTWLEPATCAPLRQLDVSTGFFANPHDLVTLSATKAYVTRYERNATPTADPADHDEGDDLLIIDPSVPSVTGRIDLSSYATTVTGATIRARPDRARLINGKVYVVLNNISGDFGAIGPARVVVIDPAMDKVTAMIDLPGGLKNCDGLSYADATKTLVVACGGDYTGPNQVASSGLAFIDTAASPPVSTRSQVATPFGGRPLAGFSGSAKGGTLGFGITFGEALNGTPKDQLWVLDVATGTATKLADASASFIYGNVVVDPSSQRVYFTDASAATPRVQVYDYANPAAPVAATPINASPSGLPSREIEWY